MRTRAGWHWFSYAPEDAKAAQAALNRLADAGLELEEVWFCAAKFKRAAGRAPACWVEPARWTGSRPADEEARGAYLSLCDEAGWELVDESRGMFWFKARPGAEPAPIQTDGGVEWEAVWRKLLAGRAWKLLYLGLWLAFAGFNFWQNDSHFWTAFFSDSTLAALAALLCALFLFVWQGVRALRYRGACRRAIGAGEVIPVPGQSSARVRGAQWVVQTALLCVMALAWLAGVGASPRPNLDGRLATWHSSSSFAVHTEYHDWSEDQFLSVDDYDCRFSWLAGWIVSDLVSDEGDQRYLDRQTILHSHRAVEPERAALGFDAAWTYPLDGGREGLILRQGNRVVRIEAAARLTGPAELEKLRSWLGLEGAK